MGSVVFGIPTELALELRDWSGARTFVETGTFQGDTALWASGHFDSVYTIEHDRDRYLAAMMRLNDKPNIHFYHGDSQEELEAVLAHMPGKTMFWLDAHWCLEGSCDTECPLLGELELLMGRPPGDVILIDDANFFVKAPPLPGVPGYWPNMIQIADVLGRGPHRRYFAINQDVIIITDDLFPPP